MTPFLCVVIALLGSAIGGGLGNAWARFCKKANRSVVEMWRVGGEQGPTERDRQAAKLRAQRLSATFRWLLPLLTGWFTVVGAIFGAGLALVLGQRAGVLK